eukprot:1190902-Prorocentrum_minimum.AAC.2
MRIRGGPCYVACYVAWVSAVITARFDWSPVREYAPCPCAIGPPSGNMLPALQLWPPSLRFATSIVSTIEKRRRLRYCERRTAVREEDPNIKSARLSPWMEALAGGKW